MLSKPTETEANGFHRGREPYFDPQNFEKLDEHLGRLIQLPELSQHCSSAVCKEGHVAILTPSLESPVTLRRLHFIGMYRYLRMAEFFEEQPPRTCTSQELEAMHTLLLPREDKEQVCNSAARGFLLWCPRR